MAESERPDFVSVPVRGRFLRVRPAAVAYLQTDGRGMAVISFIGGEILTAEISPADFETLAAGGETRTPKAARAAHRKAA